MASSLAYDTIRNEISIRRNLLPHQLVVGDTKTCALGVDHGRWLICDGRLVPRWKFPELFRVLGYNFGGSGGRFGLPDSRSRVLAAVGGSWQAGDVSGAETHTLTIQELPPHTHDISAAATGISINSAGTHTHTSNADPGDGNGLLQINSGSGTTDGGDSINNSFEPQLNQIQPLVIDSAGSHTHSITDPTHVHGAALTGGGQAFSRMQPTLFLGNVFIYAGRLAV
jgi:microcystin-dependent protein